MAEIGKPAADIGFNVTDLDGQRRFYGELLGLPHVGQLKLPHAQLHFYACGESLLKLYGMNDLEPPLPAERTRTGLAYVTVNVRDLDATFATLEQAGVTILQPVTEFDAGITLPPPIGRVRARYAMVADADGNRVELMEKA